MPTIKLTKGYEAQIDELDADLLAHRWWASVNGPKHIYAQRYRGKTDRGYEKIHLHREIGQRIMGGPIPSGMVVDHINGDTLDNRRDNLRVVPHHVNTWNQVRAGRDSHSGVVGVRLHRNRWQAYICTGHKMRALGSFDTMEEARAARLAAERERMLSAAA